MALTSFITATLLIARTVVSIYSKMEPVMIGMRLSLQTLLLVSLVQMAIMEKQLGIVYQMINGKPLIPIWGKNNFSFKNLFMHWSLLIIKLYFSKCTSNGDEINNATEEVANSAGPPTDTIFNLNNNLKDKPLISGDLLLLDNFTVTAIEAQRRWLMNETDPNNKEEGTKNFADAIVGLTNTILNSTVAFWGLLEYPRFQLIGQIQLHVEETKALLGTWLITQQNYTKNETYLGINDYLCSSTLSLLKNNSFHFLNI